MILIDTNVVSELMRPSPAGAVIDWFGQQDAAALHLSAVSEAELRRGVALLPDGQRRATLLAAIDAMIAEDFEGRVVPFDSAAASVFAAIFAERQAKGSPISFPDCQIAATARGRGRDAGQGRLRRLRNRGHRSMDGRGRGEMTGTRSDVHVRQI